MGGNTLESSRGSKCMERAISGGPMVENLKAFGVWVFQKDKDS